MPTSQFFPPHFCSDSLYALDSHLDIIKKKPSMEANHFELYYMLGNTIIIIIHN